MPARCVTVPAARCSEQVPRIHASSVPSFVTIIGVRSVRRFAGKQYLVVAPPKHAAAQLRSRDSSILCRFPVRRRGHDNPGDAVRHEVVVEPDSCRNFFAPQISCPEYQREQQSESSPDDSSRHRPTADLKGEHSSSVSSGIPADCGQKNSCFESSHQKIGSIRGRYRNRWRPSVKLGKTAMKAFVRMRSSQAKRHER